MLAIKDYNSLKILYASPVRFWQIKFSCDGNKYLLHQSGEMSENYQQLFLFSIEKDERLSFITSSSLSGNLYSHYFNHHNTVSYNKVDKAVFVKNLISSKLATCEALNKSVIKDDIALNEKTVADLEKQLKLSKESLNKKYKQLAGEEYDR